MCEFEACPVHSACPILNPDQCPILRKHHTDPETMDRFIHRYNQEQAQSEIWEIEMLSIPIIKVYGLYGKDTPTPTFFCMQ